jgi:hypothetical protein
MVTDQAIGVAGIRLVAGMAPQGVPAHVSVFTRWEKTANSITRRYRGERPC